MDARVELINIGKQAASAMADSAERVSQGLTDKAKELSKELPSGREVQEQVGAFAQDVGRKGQELAEEVKTVAQEESSNLSKAQREAGDRASDELNAA